MEKIDRRKHYVLMLDTETANTLVEIIDAIVGENGKIVEPKRQNMDMSNVLVYDCGLAVIDTHGGLYETASFVNREIFCDERDLMQSAYYGWKIPRYVEDLRAGRRKMANWYEIRQAILDIIQKYNIKEVAAHNARFDHNALNITERYLTNSRYRYFFPFGTVEFWDTMKMAQDVIVPMPTYQKFCEKNNYMVRQGKPRKTAEILYRFISGNNSFEESHTGLEDVLIEAEILWYCFRQHKPMRKLLFENKKEWPENTPFQIALLQSLKENPTINYQF